MGPHVGIKITGARPRLANGHGTLLVKLRLLTLDEISNVKELTLDSSDAFELKKKKSNFCFKTSNSFFSPNSHRTWVST